MTKYNNKVLVSIDALLDTRLALLGLLDRRLAHSLLSSDKYNTRYFDEFGYIGNNMFKRYYQFRGNNVMKNSFMTNIFTLVLTEIEYLTAKFVELGISKKTFIDVNIYPYTLTEEEKSLFIETLMVYNIIDTCDIQIVSISSIDLTMEKVSNDYDTVFLYDAVSWLEYQLSRGTSSSAINVKLYGIAILPEAIIYNTVKTLEQIFDSLSEIYKPYINYTALASDFYCCRTVMREKIKESYT